MLHSRTNMKAAVVVIQSFTNREHWKPHSKMEVRMHEDATFTLLRPATLG